MDGENKALHVKKQTEATPIYQSNSTKVDGRTTPT